MSTTRVRKGGRIDPATLPRGPHGRALCRYCTTRECTPPRRTFCSADCIHQWRLRTRPSYAKACVFKRDRGVCAVCRVDTKLLAAELWAEGLESGRAHQQRLLVLHGISRNRKVWARKLGGNLWDLDHVIPVALGGGECAEDNYQTLCIPCHRLKTAQQARDRRIAKQRGEQLSPPPSPPQIVDTD